jgi:hypothetical protein
MTTDLSETGTQKITISLPQELAERFKAQVPARQRSTFIARILEEYLAIQEQLEALDEAAGCWSDERHPDMATDADIDNWLADLRSNWQHKEDR